MYKVFSVFSSIAILVTSTGCATVTSGTTQDLSVSSKSSNGTDLTDVDCKLQNDKGKWNVKTPDVVTVHKSSKDLNINCEKTGHTKGSARVVSRMGAGMAGNLLIGGVIGAGIDHATGSAYKYPDNLVVTMGKTTVIDRKATDNETEKKVAKEESK